MRFLCGCRDDCGSIGYSRQHHMKAHQKCHTILIEPRHVCCPSGASPQKMSSTRAWICTAYQKKLVRPARMSRNNVIKLYNTMVAILKPC